MNTEKIQLEARLQKLLKALETIRKTEKQISEEIRVIYQKLGLKL